MTVKEQMDNIYRDLPLAEIPWNQESPPELLVRLVESEWVLPCEAVDLGCGAGNNAVWLATKGFRMTGIDISPTALRLAKHLAQNKGTECRFIVADLTGRLEGLDCCFDFAYDWEVLHHIFPENRQRYVRNVCNILRPRARYLSVSFSEEDASFEGDGKYRRTALGTTLYFSSKTEIRELFDPLFEIEELSTVEILGKNVPHKAIWALMNKKA